MGNPTYEQVCTGSTGHAEVVQITYNSQQINYDLILNVFFGTHDPTTLNRQGADVGTQYRSVIFYHDERQEKVAKAKIKQIEKDAIWENSLVTQVQALVDFYPAEEYHQNYFKRNPFAGYCQAVISPKVAKFRARYSEMLRQ